MANLNSFGRLEILMPDVEYTNANIVEALNKMLPIHNQNSADIDKLWDYYTGKQDILNRQKEVREEICNKIVENHAAEIVNFKTGFTFGEPVQYVYRGESQQGENAGDDEGISLLNEIMDLADKPTKDRELAEWFYICGVSHRMALLDGEELNIYVCDPRYTFVAKSNDFRREPVLAVTYVNESGASGLNSSTKYSVYSKKHYWLIEGSDIKESRPIYSGIPIVEYRLSPSRQGCFEVVLPILDALNNMASNRMDGIEQTIQNFIWFNNCEVDEEQFAELKAKGGITTRSANGAPASIQVLSTDLDQQQSQTFVDYEYQTMLTIAAVPDRKASAGGNTGQALVIGQGWTNAESAAKSMELEFKAAEKRFLKLALRYLQNTKSHSAVLNKVKLSDVDIKFTRNKTDNLLTKTQGLMNLLEAGVHPRIAIANCGLFSDPEQVFVDSTEYLEKWRVEQQTEQPESEALTGELERIMQAFDNRKNGGVEAV